MAVDKNIKTYNIDTPITSLKPDEVKLETTARASQTPISFKNDKKEDPVVSLLRDPEFLKLSKKDQDARIKQIMPHASDEEITTLINTAKAYIKSETTTKELLSTNVSEEVVEQKTSTAPSEQIPSAKNVEDNTDISRTSTSIETLISEEIKVEEQSVLAETTTAITDAIMEEGTRLAEEAGEKLGADATIEDVIASIKAKKPEELTDKDKKILAFMSLKTGDKDGIKTVIEQFIPELEATISPDIVKSEEWQQKAPIEKLNIRADKLMEQIVPNYDKLDEKQQNKIKNELIEAVGQKLDPNWGKLDIQTKQAKMDLFAVVVDATENSNLSVKQFLNAKPDEQASMIMKYAQDKVFDKFYNDPSAYNDKFKKLPLDKQLDTMIDYAIKTIDPNISKEDIVSKRNQYIDLVGSRMYENWSSLSDDDKFLKKSSLGLELAAIRKSESSLLEYNALSPAEKARYRNNAIADIIKDPNITPEYKEDLYKMRIENEARIYFNKEDVSYADQIQYLEYKKSEVGLTPEEQENLKRLEVACKNKEFDKTEYRRTEIRFEHSIRANGGDVDKTINDYCASKNITREDLISDPEKLERLLRKTSSADTIRSICEVLGIEYKPEYSKFISKNDHIISLADAKVDQDQIAYQRRLGDAHHGGYKKIVSNEAEIYFKDFKDTKAQIEIAQSITNLDVKYSENIAIGANENLKKEARQAFIKGYTSSANTSNEAAAEFTKYSITTAKNDAQLLENAQALSGVKRESVTRAMIEVEPQVRETARKEYGQYVTKAIDNNGYDVKTRDSMHQERGEIYRTNNEVSSKKSSGTQTSSQKQTSASGQNQNVSQATSTSSTQQANTSAGTKSSAQTSPAVSKSSAVAPKSSASSTSASSSSQASVQTSRTDVKYVNYASAVTEALTSKKEVVLERITKVISDFQKSAQNISDKPSAAPAVASSEKDAPDSQKEVKTEENIVESYVDHAQDTDKIPPAVLQELKSAYSNSGMVGLYSKLGEIGTGIQEKFLNYFAKYSDSNTLHSFAKSFSANKDVIIQLYQSSNDPLLLLYLGEADQKALLASGKIKLNDFLRYASPSTIANYINDLNKTGATSRLKEILGVLDLSQQSYASSLLGNNSPQKGGDEWFRQMRENMSSLKNPIMDEGLAVGSNKTSMGRNYDKMKQRGPFYFSA